MWARVSRYSHLAWVPLRVLAGASLMSHGYSKIFEPGKLDSFTDGVEKLGFPAPALFAVLAALSELVGGLFLALGLFVRPAALFIAITMAVAAFLQHSTDPFGKKELALVYLVVSVGFFFHGAGAGSVENLMRRVR